MFVDGGGCGKGLSGVEEEMVVSEELFLSGLVRAELRPCEHQSELSFPSDDTNLSDSIEPIMYSLLLVIFLWSQCWLG